jgi:hypothetical protein
MRMVSLNMALSLKNAGLNWEPAQGDQFVVPDRGLDDVVFTVNDMAVILETFQGVQAVTFHGTPEWALDYVYVGDALWLPNEAQLRMRLKEVLAAAGTTVFDLLYVDGTYNCRFEWHDESLAFRSPDADEAYGQALLHLIG